MENIKEIIEEIECKYDNDYLLDKDFEYINELEQ